jgi:hypothetical protein
MSDPNIDPRYPRNYQRSTGAGGWGVALAAIALLVLLAVFAFDWNGTSNQSTVMNEQPQTQQPTIEPQGTQQPSQPAPEQPPPGGGSTTQP